MKKRCYKCKTIKDISCFGIKSTKPDGHQSICKECQRVERKKYYDANKEKEFANHKRYEISHRKEINVRRSKYRYETPGYFKKAHEAVKRRAAVDIAFLVTCRTRYRIERALSIQNAKSFTRILGLVGCSITEFIAHLESTFYDGMTWELYREGLMQIDHIIPCALFNLNDAEHQLACFNFSNTRMLWTKDNLSRKLNNHLPEGELDAFVHRVNR